MDFPNILKEIKKFSRDKLDIAEMEDSTIFVAKNFIQILQHAEKDLRVKEAVFEELYIECIKHLKIMCTKGSSFQNLITNTHGMLQTLHKIINCEVLDLPQNLELKSFQLLANLCVNNKWSQEKIWTSMSDAIVTKFKSGDSSHINVGAMIVYNLMLSKVSQLDSLQIIEISLHHYANFLKDTAKPLPDFVHILLDFMICRNGDILEVYQQLGPQDAKTFLYYVHDHLEDDSSEPIDKSLLHQLTVEFKKKSDCILKTVTTYVDSIEPEVVVTLLDIISTATGQEKYLKYLKDDRSLFLNLGCLLQALHKIGKASDTIFSPIQKLESLVPTSSENGDFEKEISYAMKTKLVKSLANLSHGNKRNQELAREMEIMLSIFECTNADARNPLIKEWSILAIRNLCEDNPENQEIVRNLTKVGDAENPLLKEMGLETGMLRIGKQ